MAQQTDWKPYFGVRRAVDTQPRDTKSFWSVTAITGSLTGDPKDTPNTLTVVEIGLSFFG